MDDTYKIMDRFFYWLILAGAAMSVLYFDQDLHNYQVGKSSVFIFIVGFASLYTIFRHWSEKSLVVNWYTIALFLYFLSYPFSYLFSVNPHLTLWGSYEYQGGLVFIFAGVMMITALKIESRGFFSFKGLLWALIIPAAIHSLVALFQSLDLLGAIIHVGDTRLPWGMLGNLNISGDYIATTLPLTVAFVFSKEKHEKILGSIAALLITYALYLSECRGAILGVFVGFVAAIQLYFHYYKTKWYWLPIYIIAAVVLISLFLMLFFPDDFPLKTRLITFFMRYHAWKLSLGAIFDYPIFGNGYKNFPFAFYPLRTKEFIDVMQVQFHNYEYFFSPHNNLIETVIERGFYGLLTLLSLFVLGFYRIFLALKEETIERPLLLALTGALVSFFVWTFANWETLATIPVIFIIFFLVEKIEIKEKKINISLKWPLRIFVSLASIFYLYVSYHQSRLYMVDQDFSKIVRGAISNRTERLAEIIRNTIPPRHYYTFTYAQLRQPEVVAIPDKSKREDEARKALEIITPNVEIQFEPNNTRYIKYKFHQILSDFSNAEKTLNDMLKLDPLHYTAMTELAKINFTVHRNGAKGMSLLNQALKIKANYLDANLMMAQIEAQSGRKENAISRLRFMIQEYPKREEHIVALINQITK